MIYNLFILFISPERKLYLAFYNFKLLKTKYNEIAFSNVNLL